MSENITVKDVAKGFYQPCSRIYKYIKEGRFNGAYKKVNGKYIFNKKALFNCCENNFQSCDIINVD